MPAQASHGHPAKPGLGLRVFEESHMSKGALGTFLHEGSRATHSIFLPGQFPTLPVESICRERQQKGYLSIIP